MKLSLRPTECNKKLTPAVKCRRFHINLFFLSVEVIQSLSKLVTCKSDLPSALTRQINEYTLDSVSELAVKKQALFLDIIHEFFSLLEILTGSRSKHKYGGDRSNDLKIVEHVMMTFPVGLDHSDVLNIVVNHELIYTDLLINSRDHDLLINGLI